MHLMTKGERETNVCEVPITFAKCLKYLCFASKRVVQWLIRGPYLSGTRLHVHTITMSIAHSILYIQHCILHFIHLRRHIHVITHYMNVYMYVTLDSYSFISLGM